MMPVKLTRQQRRALEREATEIGDVTQADRRFFERFPHRKFRVRSMSRAELASLEIAAGAPLIPLAPDEAAFTVVKNVVPGARLRIHVPGPADESGTEGAEEVGAWLWNRFAQRCPSIFERENALRKAFGSSNGPDTVDRGAG